MVSMCVTRIFDRLYVPADHEIENEAIFAPWLVFNSDIRRLQISMAD